MHQRPIHRRILKISKIFELFDEIFTIEDSNFIPKPDQGSMESS